MSFIWVMYVLRSLLTYAAIYEHDALGITTALTNLTFKQFGENDHYNTHSHREEQTHDFI